jgi:FkbM family methyltransferase
MKIPFDLTYKVNGVRFAVNSKVEDYRVRKYGGEKDFVLSLIDDLGPGDVLVDVGASVGLVSLLAAKKGAKVKAFEPDPAVLIRFHKNLTLNHKEIQDRVTDFGMALSNKSGTVSISKVDSLSARLFDRDVSDIDPEANITDGVLCSTLDLLDFEASHIKIDVEGAELLVLLGGLEVLANERPKLWIELHPSKLIGGTVDEFFELLISKLGYSIRSMTGRGDEIHIIAE